MLHIILLILKIMGIAVLVILGLLLTVLLLVLLVPLRYSVNGFFYGKLKGKARITWLLHILSISIAFEEDLSVAVRIFGYRLFAEKAQDKDKEKKAGKREEDLVMQTMEVSPDEEMMSPHPEYKGQKGKASAREHQKKASQGAAGREKNGSVPRQEETQQKIPVLSVSEPEVKKGRISTLINRIRTKIRLILLKIQYLFRRICDTLKNTSEKKEQFLELISNKENQASVKLLWKQLKKLLRHILPGKGKGKITFGFEDPYLTGQVLTYASVIYPFCYRHLELYPLFDQQMLEGEGYFKGRIRIGTLLVICGHLLLDKNIRTLVKKLLR